MISWSVADNSVLLLLHISFSSSSSRTALSKSLFIATEFPEGGNAGEFQTLFKGQAYCISLDHLSEKATLRPGGQACKYTLTLWEKLTCFLDYPELELSNNLAENSMRPVALGRSNWIHIGSSQAGPRVAAILSVIESCRRLNIRVRDYLTQILPGLVDMPIQRVAELTPAAWADKTQS